MRTGIIFACLIFTSTSTFATTILNGTYKAVSGDCESIYLPNESDSYKMSDWEVASGLEIAVGEKSARLTYSIPHKERKVEASLDVGFWGAQYKKQISEGSFLSGKTYNWALSAVDEGKINLHYDSNVIFMGIATTTDVDCEMDLVK